MSTPVHIIADDNIPAGECVIEEVPMLSYGVSVNDTSYIVLCKSRAANESFYQWYNINIMIPFINDIKRVYGLDANATTWYQLDGEDTQIRCYEDNNILQELENNHIVVGKPSGSTTEITQPCDRGNIFKASKKSYKKYIRYSDRH